MLFERATTNADSKGLPRIVANNELSEESKKFESYNDDFTSLLESRQATAQLPPLSRPSPPPTPAAIQDRHGNGQQASILAVASLGGPSVMSTVDATVLDSIKQNIEHQLDIADRLLVYGDTANMHKKPASANVTPTGRIKRVRPGLQYRDHKIESYCRKYINSQTKTSLPSEEDEQITMSASRISVLPGENKPWDLYTGRETTQPLRKRHLRQYRPAVGKNIYQQETPSSSYSSPPERLLVAAAHRRLETPTRHGGLFDDSIVHDTAENTSLESFKTRLRKAYQTDSPATPVFNSTTPASPSILMPHHFPKQAFHEPKESNSEDISNLHLFNGIDSHGSVSDSSFTPGFGYDMFSDSNDPFPLDISKVELLINFQNASSSQTFPSSDDIDMNYNAFTTPNPKSDYSFSDFSSSQNQSQDIPNSSLLSLNFGSFSPRMSSQASDSRIPSLAFTSPTSQKGPPSSPPELLWTPTRNVSRSWDEMIEHKGKSEIDFTERVEEEGRSVDDTYNYDYVSGLSISMFESSPNSIADNLDRNWMM
jgi:hypothetical protein